MTQTRPKTVTDCLGSRFTLHLRKLLSQVIKRILSSREFLTFLTLTYLTLDRVIPVLFVTVKTV
jgi:hypothetical protein